VQAFHRYLYRETSVDETENFGRNLATPEGSVCRNDVMLEIIGDSQTPKLDARKAATALPRSECTLSQPPHGAGRRHLPVPTSLSSVAFFLLEPRV
jgi:hypothetical protein